MNRRLLYLLLAALPMLAQVYNFSDGGKATRMELAANEVYVIVDQGANQKTAMAQARKSFGAGLDSTVAVGSTSFVAVFSKKAQGGAQRLAAGRPVFQMAKSTAPVFYDAREVRRDAARRFMTSRLLVKLSDAAWDKLRRATGAQSREKSLIEGWWLVDYGDPYAALDAVQSLTAEGGWEFTPVFSRMYRKRQTATGTLARPVNDPLYPNQWHLSTNNAGPTLQMKASWDVATGTGINVAVIDDALDVAHEDLLGNAYPLATNYHRNYRGGTLGANDPSPGGPDDSHGTQCAGLAAATGFNNVGVIGVAPAARLMGLRLIGDGSTDADTGDAMAWQPPNLVTHVSSNSWGPNDDGKALGDLPALQLAGIEKAIAYRGGLGTVFVVSAGNGRGNGDNASYDAFASSRYAIQVAAVGRDGSPSSYSEQGTALAISAFGGEFNPPEVMWTTNVSGAAAFDKLKTDFPDSQAPVNYSDSFNGTSAAAPQVSGAAALLLQTRPGLGYRDVKEILMKTACKAACVKTGAAPLGDPFVDNGSGFSFSHSFGAGLMNVSAAIEAAKTWNTLGTLTSVTQASAAQTAVPDNDPAGATFTFDLTPLQKLRVENVEFTVTVAHPNRGELRFILTSPSGMTSIVGTRTPDTAADFTNYVFTSVRHWGENSQGVWKVQAIDTVANGNGGTASNFSIKVFGTAAPAAPAPAVTITDPRVIRSTATTATIQWSTTGPVATTNLEYGTTVNYGATSAAATTNDPAQPNQWAVELTGLAASTLYNYRISATPAGGAKVTSANLTFTTPAPPAPPAPPKLSRGRFNFDGTAVVLGQDNILAATGGTNALLDMNDLNGGEVVTGDRVTFQLADGGAFITAAANGALTAGPTTAGAAETFEVTVLNGFRLKAGNNRWVKVQGDRKLAATATDAGDSLQFLGGEVAAPPPAPTPGARTRLSPGEVLLPNNQLLSPNRSYRLQYQPNGNLVLYKVADNTVIWNSGTEGRTPSRLVMQAEDGNLVMYGIDNNAQWHSNTFGAANNNSTALLQDDGRFIIVNSIGQVIWENGTRPALQPPPVRSRLIPGAALLPGQSLVSENGTYTATYQADGNLVVKRGDAVLWHTGTFDRPVGPGRVCMQTDGNLVMYDKNDAPVWFTSTNATVNKYSEVVLQTDGNLVVYNPNGAPVWNWFANR